MLDVPSKFQKGGGVFHIAKKIVEKTTSSNIGKKF